MATTKSKKAQAVREQAGDPVIYETRLRYRGGRDLPKRIKRNPRWVKVKGKWQMMDVRNPVHRVTADVHDGTAKALTTSAPPDVPSLSWWYTVDKNAARDRRRKEAREDALAGALAAAAIHEEETALPAQPTLPAPNSDDGGERRPSRGIKDVEQRYIPPAEGPHHRLRRPDEQTEEEREAQRRADAAARLEARRSQAGVDEQTFALLRQHLGDGAPLPALAKQAGVTPAEVRRRLGEAIDRMRAVSRGLVADFRTTAGKD